MIALFATVFNFTICYITGTTQQPLLSVWFALPPLESRDWHVLGFLGYMVTELDLERELPGHDRITLMKHILHVINIEHNSGVGF